MTLSSTVNTAFYVGNGITTSFAASFYFQNATDLLVETYNPITLVTTTLVLNVDYTLSPASPTDPNFGWPTGANVVFNSAPANGLDVNIYRAVQPLQGLSIPTSGPFPSKPIEAQLDREMMAVQDEQTFNEDLAVTIPLALEGTFNKALPANIGSSASASSALGINSTYNGFEVGPSFGAIADAAANAAAAAASAAAAAISETAAAAAEVSAAASAAAASAAADSVTWQDIIFVNHTNSPVNVSSTSRAFLYVADCSAGAVVFNLPHISTLDLTSPFNIGIKKADSSANASTINAFSGDTIDGSASATLSEQNQSVTLSADGAASEWISQGFGLITAAGVQASNSGHTILTGVTAQAQLDETDSELTYVANKALKLPNTLRFGTGSGSYYGSYYFTVASANATAGAVYTNNTHNFTVVRTISGSTLLLCTSNGAPTSSGTLTKSSGTGDATITFSLAELPTYAVVEMAGGGGGGGGGGSSLGGSGGGGAGAYMKFMLNSLSPPYTYIMAAAVSAGLAGNPSSFNATNICAGGGAGSNAGSSNPAGGAGGTITFGGLGQLMQEVPGGDGQGGAAGNVESSGGMGGSSFFGGGGAGGAGKTSGGTGNSGGPGQGWGSGGGGGGGSLNNTGGAGGAGNVGNLTITEYWM